jgi:hypothetical protein
MGLERKHPAAVILVPDIYLLDSRAAGGSATRDCPSRETIGDETGIYHLDGCPGAVSGMSPYDVLPVRDIPLANEATSIPYVARPVTINDGKRKNEIKARTFLSWPHSMTQRDPSTYPEPNKFMPDRFLETDAETGRRVARYGKLRPWGAGAGICKGRTFTEKEVLCVAEAIISLWNIGPVGGT